MIRVYHGSNVVVQSPLVGIGRKALDFGEGFYVTALFPQAEVWARNKARYYMQPEGMVTCYDFDLEALDLLSSSRLYDYIQYSHNGEATITFD